MAEIKVGAWVQYVGALPEFSGMIGSVTSIIPVRRGRASITVKTPNNRLFAGLAYEFVVVRDVPPPEPPPFQVGDRVRISENFPFEQISGREARIVGYDDRKWFKVDVPDVPNAYRDAVSWYVLASFMTKVGTEPVIPLKPTTYPVSQLLEHLPLCVREGCKLDLVYDPRYQTMKAFHNGESRTWRDDDSRPLWIPTITDWLRRRHDARDPHGHDWDLRRQRRLRDNADSFTESDPWIAGKRLS